MANRTPEQWRTYLAEKLDHQAREHHKWNCYYEGEHPLPDAPPGARMEFLRLMRLSKSNWMELIVDAVAERLVVAGVRFGNQQQADVDIWNTIWQPNSLDAEHGQVHTEALIGGNAAVLVWPSNVPGNAPVVSVEHPTQVYIETAGGHVRRRRAMIKRYVDDGVEYVIVVLDRTVTGNVTMVYKWRRDMRSTAYEEHTDVGDPGPSFPHPLDVVSAVPFSNKRRMIGAGVSELAGGPTDIQDRINETIFGRLSAQRFSAFRQRWVTGMEIPVDPETGKAVEPFKAAIDRLWMAEAGGPGEPEVKFGEFSATDLAPYIKAVEADIQHLAAISRTPPHYLLGQSGAFPSGESLKATETGLVAKVVARSLAFGEAWEEVIRLALGAMQDARAADTSLEVIWKDPEAKSLGELVDALVKLASIGVPQEALWERYGASPQEIARWRAIAARASLAEAAALRRQSPEAARAVLPGTTAPERAERDAAPPAAAPAETVAALAGAR